MSPSATGVFFCHLPIILAPFCYSNADDELKNKMHWRWVYTVPKGCNSFPLVQSDVIMLWFSELLLQFCSPFIEQHSAGLAIRHFPPHYNAATLWCLGKKANRREIRHGMSWRGNQVFRWPQALNPLDHPSAVRALIRVAEGRLLLRRSCPIFCLCKKFLPSPHLFGKLASGICFMWKYANG